MKINRKIMIRNQYAGLQRKDNIWFNQTESVSVFVDYLIKNNIDLFDFILAHDTGTFETLYFREHKNNMCCFYVAFPFPNQINDCMESFKTGVTMSDFCYYTEPPSHQFEPTEPFIKIMSQRTAIGYYIPSRNVLLLRDFTHYRDSTLNFCLNMFPKIMEVIEKVSDPVMEKENEFKITFGADPEFCFWKNDQVVPAHDLLVKKYQPTVSLCDSSVEIGTDGNSSTGELRPKQADSADGLHKNIQSLLKKIYDDFPEYEMDCVGNKLPLGFHIHFGNIYFGKENALNFVKVLDYYLGNIFLPLSGIARGSYSKMSAMEYKNYGFEYRSLPAIIMHHPEILKIVLKLCENLAKSFIVFEKDFLIKMKSPKKLEYLEFITNEEYKKLIKFVYSNIPMLERERQQGKAFKNWFEPRPEQAKVFFSGDEIGKTVKQIIMNHKICTINNIFFFGLRVSRENNVIMTNLKNPIPDNPYFKSIPIDIKSRKNRMMIGLPYNIRMGHDTSDLKIICSLDIIYDTFKEAMKTNGFIFEDKRESFAERLFNEPAIQNIPIEDEEWDLDDTAFRDDSSEDDEEENGF